MIRDDRVISLTKVQDLGRLVALYAEVHWLAIIWKEAGRNARIRELGASKSRMSLTHVTQRDREIHQPGLSRALRCGRISGYAKPRQSSRCFRSCELHEHIRKCHRRM
jgi:hypothetical protein